MKKVVYRGLIGSVLEYGSVCIAGMADTHVIARTHSVSSIEDINGPNGIYTQQKSRGSDWDFTATT
jgi:hypothetical protein